MATYTLATTRARSRFLSLVRDAGESFSRYVFTHRGAPQAVMIGVSEFEGWLETLEISESDSWRKALAQARREDRPGKRLSYETVVGPHPRPRRRR